MKTTNTIMRVLSVLFVSILITSCSPEDGKDGEQGLQGESGIDGNANVRVYTKDIGNMTWETIGNNNSGYQRLEILAPNVLTSNVLNNSTILVYVYTSDFNGDWALLPYYTERDIRVQSDIRVGEIILKRDQEGQPYTQSWHDKIKIVIIEESSSSVLSRRFTNKNFQEMSYYQVMDYLGFEY